MNTDLNKLYQELCQRLGAIRQNIDELEEQEKELKKRIENVKWVHKNLPKEEPVTPEIVEEPNANS